MNKNLHSFTHSIIVAALVTAAHSAEAAKRVVIDKIKPQNASTSLAAPQGIEELVGLAANELRPLRSQSYANGTVVTRFQQYHLGVPIWGESVVQAQAARNGKRELSGAILQDLSNDLPSAKPIFSVADALMQAKTKAQAFYTTNDAAELYVMRDSKGIAHLVYLVSFFIPHASKPSEPHFMIDANNGVIWKQWEGLNRIDASGPGGNKKTGQYEFGTAPYGPLVVTSDCQMSSVNVSAIDMQNGTTNTVPFQFSCPRNTYKSVNDAYSPINDAYYYGTATFNMYSAWLSLRPISHSLVMKVHYGNYTSAAWSGGATGYAIFGDGDTQFYPMTTLDVVAHEISHGFTAQNSKLIGYQESGGMNEAFSDMAGEAVENHLKGTNDFLSGAEVTKTTTAYRYLNNPPLDGMSRDNYFYYSPFDDIHHSAGIYNKAFYLLATKAGWTTRKAFEVMADANRLYWNPNSTFASGVCGVENAAANRVYVVADVTASFNSVGAVCDRDFKSAAEYLYYAYVGRPADTTGLTSTVNAMKAANAPTTIYGMNDAYTSNPSFKALVDSFAGSAESMALYPASDTASFVNSIYQAALGRTADASGLAFWTNAISSGSLSRAQAPLSIVAAAESHATENGQGGLDAAMVVRKDAIALYFTIAIDTAAEAAAYSGTAAALKARQMLAQVTATTNVNTFQATANATLAAIVAGQ